MSLRFLILDLIVKSFRLLSLWFQALFCLSLLTGCFAPDSFRSALFSSNSELTDDELLVSAKSGLQTYNQECNSCHGEAVASGLQNRKMSSSSDLQDSFANVSEMSYLKERVNADQLKNLINLFSYIKNKGEAPPLGDDSGVPADGLPAYEQEVSFLEVKSILDNACTSCHFDYHASWENYGEEDFINNGLVVKGWPTSSQLIQRISYYKASNSNMPLPNTNQKFAFTELDFSKIVKWVKSMQADSTGGGSGGSGSDGNAAGSVKAERYPAAASGKYLSGILGEVFFDQSQFTTKNRKAYESLSKDPTSFGGACNFYSTYSGDDCGEIMSAGMSNTLDGEFSVVKALNKRVACEQIIDSGASVAASRFSFDLTKPITDNDLKKVHSLFYRSRSISSVELDALKNFRDALENKNAPQKEQWEFLFLVLCEQPGWEFL